MGEVFWEILYVVYIVQKISPFLKKNLVSSSHVCSFILRVLKIANARLGSNMHSKLIPLQLIITLA